MLTLSFGIYMLRLLGMVLAVYNLCWTTKYFIRWLDDMMSPVLIFRAIIFLVAFSSFSFHFSVVFLIVQEIPHWWLFFNVLTNILVQTVIIVSKNLNFDHRFEKLWGVSDQVDVIENILLLKRTNPDAANTALEEIENQTVKALAEKL